MKPFASIALAGLGLAGMALAQPAKAQGSPDQCPPFEMVGEGPDLILTPGLGSSPEVWGGVVESLSADYRVTLVHVAGFAGREPVGESDEVVETAAREVIAHLDCQGIESALYAGHSLGGFLGLKLAIENPGRIEGLVVVDALPFYPLIFNPAATAENVRPQAEAFRSQITGQDDATFEAGQRMGVRSLVKNAAYHDRVVGWSLASDRASFAGAFHALMTTDLRDRLDSITTPTTIIVAANAFAPRSRVEPLYEAAYERLKNVDIDVIEDSYHFIMFDQPEAFETALRKALSKETTHSDTSSD